LPRVVFLAVAMGRVLSLVVVMVYTVYTVYTVSVEQPLPSARQATVTAQGVFCQARDSSRSRCADWG
jgi:hypothetical protein